MKLEREKPSANVEADCLGLLADTDGDAGHAALACLEEVGSLRSAYVASPNSPGSADQRLLDFTKFQAAFRLEQADTPGEPTAEQLGSRLDDFKKRLPEYVAEELELAAIFESPASDKD